MKRPSYRTFIPGKTIRVRRGDDLIKIARRYDVRGGWKTVFNLNRKKFNTQIKLDRRIFIGQVVRIRR